MRYDVMERKTFSPFQWGAFWELRLTLNLKGKRSKSSTDYDAEQAGCSLWRCWEPAEKAVDLGLRINCSQKRWHCTDDWTGLRGHAKHSLGSPRNNYGKTLQRTRSPTSAGLNKSQEEVDHFCWVSPCVPQGGCHRAGWCSRCCQPPPIPPRLLQGPLAHRSLAAPTSLCLKAFSASWSLLCSTCLVGWKRLGINASRSSLQPMTDESWYTNAPAPSPPR